MRRFVSVNRKKYGNIIRIIIIMLSVFFILRIFFLTFSDEIKRAKTAIKTSAISGIYGRIMESGSAIIGYHSVKAKEAYPFPLNIASDYYYIHNYVSEESSEKYINLVNTSGNRKNKIIGKIGFNSDIDEILPREYILTNGAIFDEKEYRYYVETGAFSSDTQELPVKIMDGAIDYSEINSKQKENEKTAETMKTSSGVPFTMKQLNNVGFLIRNFYIVDSSTKVTEDLFDAEILLSKDMTIKTSNDKPQILIYHTHSQETFADSREGVTEDTVVGVGDILAEILEEKYGYNVIHDRSVYDLVDGKLDRNKAYNLARKSISKILEENPTIEVLIDLHRDGAEKRSTYINGQETAQIMLLNGLSTNQNGPITRLDNPYLQDNLAFSLQLHLKSLELYPGLFFKNYLQAYRYNLDLRPKSILMELGTHKNSLQSAKNAMEPFAEILNAVLQGE